MDSAGYRLTEPRRAVAELIAAREGHFSAADLLDDARVRRLDIGRATVFRSLDLLTELGLLERLDLPTGEHAYVPCDPVHHHHIVCSSCGRVTEIDDRGLAAAVEGIQRSTGWQVESHRLELYGRCPRCRSRRPA
jgi:Fur family ferric uptake transcriptional regulator